MNEFSPNWRSLYSSHFRRSGTVQEPCIWNMGHTAWERGTWTPGNDGGSRRKLAVGVHGNTAALKSPTPASSVTDSALHAVGGYHLLHGERG